LYSVEIVYCKSNLDMEDREREGVRGGEKERERERGEIKGKGEGVKRQVKRQIEGLEIIRQSVDVLSINMISLLNNYNYNYNSSSSYNYYSNLLILLDKV